MLTWLFNKVFKGKHSEIFYLSPIINCILCYYLMMPHQELKGGLEISITLIIFLFFSIIGIGRTLHKFMTTLQKPYCKENLHIVLSSIFAVITFFAAIYTMIYILIPGSFHGFDAGNQLDRTINVLYYSIITFTTVGYGDIYPVASIAKILVSAETMSFFIFFVILTTNRKTFFKSKEEHSE